MTLRERLADPSPDVRIAAYRSLIGARSLHALRLLAEGLDDPHDGVVTAAAEMLMETTDLGPRTIVAFHPRRAARRVAVRMTDDVDLLYLLLADPETRAEAIERVRQSPPIGRSPQRAAILRRLLADGSLPPADVARLFADDPDSLAWLVLQLVRAAIDASTETVDDRPVQLAQLNAPVPAAFVTIVELLDAVPAAWLRTLAHREVLREDEGPRTAFLAWLSLTVYAARHHAAHASWTPESLAIESSMMPWLLLDAALPLALRRDALRAAAGLTGELVDRNAFAWDAQFVLGCLFDPVAHRASGVHDLRAAYALLDVRSVGIPLKKMHERLGIHAIVRAAPEGASDLAWMIGKTLVRRAEHVVGEEWLTAIGYAEPRAFVDITRTLPSSWWIDVVHRLDPPKLDALLTALADSDAPAATWSTWAAALTHSRPTAGAMLEQHGYRIVRAGTPAFPRAISDAQEKAADKLGAPPVIQHLATGIV
ncbi:MAG: HEAT repeat domain-containing protein, partial [Acidobacteria bacterium]|nr:HEAT repeat domain-containing protein [Acidobacteriota bacterium]